MCVCVCVCVCVCNVTYMSNTASVTHCTNCTVLTADVISNPPPTPSLLPDSEQQVAAAHQRNKQDKRPQNVKRTCVSARRTLVTAKCDLCVLFPAALIISPLRSFFTMCEAAAPVIMFVERGLFVLNSQRWPTYVLGKVTYGLHD